MLSAEKLIGKVVNAFFLSTMNREQNEFVGIQHQAPATHPNPNASPVLGAMIYVYGNVLLRNVYRELATTSSYEAWPT